MLGFRTNIPAQKYLKKCLSYFTLIKAKRVRMVYKTILRKVCHFAKRKILLKILIAKALIYACKVICLFTRVFIWI